MLSADLVIINSNVITITTEKTQAEAVAIKNGLFVGVGTNEQIRYFIGKNTVKIDLEGNTIVPGFIDSHLHGASFGRHLSEVNLRYVKSIEEIKQKVRDKVKQTPKDKWILGRGWDQDKLHEQRYPTRYDLDEVASDHAVFLLRVCSHLGVVNSTALRLAGINGETKQPEGGCIEKDSITHEMNGILKENALDLIYKILPRETQEEFNDLCLKSCRKIVEEGVTTVHWIVSSKNEIRALQQLRRDNALPLRIYVMLPVELLDNIVDLGLTTGFGDDWMRIGCIKILADGSLGARTAALERPYEDAPETNGMLLYTEKQLEKLARRAHIAGLQLAIHAIGDKTINIVLNIIEKILRETPNKNHRHRVEHASVLNPRLIKKMREINVVASVQPQFIISDSWVRNRLGESRARWTYALRSILKEGINVIGGSDSPIEPVSPLSGIFAAVTQDEFPQERLTVYQALRLYTLAGAYASFEEDVKGSIEIGKMADLVVLSENPLEVSPNQIENIKTLMTVVDGKIVYVGKQLKHQLSLETDLQFDETHG